MSETLQVEAARIPDRDRLLVELKEAGLDAHAIDEVGIEVLADSQEDELFRQVESMIMTLGAPFVPIKHDGVIYVRPPVS